MLEELCDREADVFGDLAQQRRRNIATGMHRNGSTASRAVAKLLV